MVKELASFRLVEVLLRLSLKTDDIIFNHILRAKVPYEQFWKRLEYAYSGVVGLHAEKFSANSHLSEKAALVTIIREPISHLLSW